MWPKAPRYTSTRSVRASDNPSPTRHADSVARTHSFRHICRRRFGGTISGLSCASSTEANWSDRAYRAIALRHRAVAADRGSDQDNLIARMVRSNQRDTLGDNGELAAEVLCRTTAYDGCPPIADTVLN